MNFVGEFYFTQISTIYRKFQIFVNDELNQHNVNASEVPYLVGLLFYGDGILQDELSKATKIDKAATSRALRSLEAKKFIYRAESSHSNRHKQVFLTETGKALKPHFEAALNKWSEILFSNLSEAEKQITINCLYKMASAVAGDSNQHTPQSRTAPNYIYGFM